MKRKQKQLLKKRFLRKEKGSNLYIWAMTAFLLLFSMFSLSFYERSADTISDNLKTSLDAATLAATTYNMEKLTKEDSFGVTGCVYNGASLTEDERAMVLKRYEVFQEALMNNVGLDDNFNFKGGTCGWACNFISSGGLTVKSFVIYDIVENSVYSYRIEDISSKTSSPAITKSYCGEVGNAKTEPFLAKDKIIQPDITSPVLLAKIQFPVNTKIMTNGIFSFIYADEEEENKPVKDNLIVTRYSLTGIKQNY